MSGRKLHRKIVKPIQVKFYIKLQTVSISFICETVLNYENAWYDQQGKGLIFYFKCRLLWVPRNGKSFLYEISGAYQYTCTRKCTCIQLGAASIGSLATLFVF